MHLKFSLLFNNSSVAFITLAKTALSLFYVPTLLSAIFHAKRTTYIFDSNLHTTKSVRQNPSPLRIESPFKYFTHQLCCLQFSAQISPLFSLLFASTTKFVSSKSPSTRTTSMFRLSRTNYVVDHFSPKTYTLHFLLCVATS